MLSLRTGQLMSYSVRASWKFSSRGHSKLRTMVSPRMLKVVDAV